MGMIGWRKIIGYVELGTEIMHQEKKKKKVKNKPESGIQNIKRPRKLISKKSTHTGDESFINY